MEGLSTSRSYQGMAYLHKTHELELFFFLHFSKDLSSNEEYVTETICNLKNLNYLLSGPVQKKLADLPHSLSNCCGSELDTGIT